MCALSTLLTQGNSGANSSLHFAELAQLVERRLAKAKVAGSNPVFRSNDKGPALLRNLKGPGPSFWPRRVLGPQLDLARATPCGRSPRPRARPGERRSLQPASPWPRG